MPLPIGESHDEEEEAVLEGPKKKKTHQDRAVEKGWHAHRDLWYQYKVEGVDPKKLCPYKTDHGGFRRSWIMGWHRFLPGALDEITRIEDAQVFKRLDKVVSSEAS
jgi:ribosome modulation factor